MSNKRTRVTGLEKEQIVRAFLDGRTHAEIVSEFRRCIPTIAQILRDAGVPPRRGPGSIRKAQRAEHLRICKKCNQVKPADQFYGSSGRTCSECHKATTSARRRDREAAWDATTDEGLMQILRSRRRYLQEKYKLTPEEAFEFYRRRVCEICGIGVVSSDKRNRKLHDLDHDHVTGKIRGLLCSGHNRAIGFFGDDPRILDAAAVYLGRAAQQV